jgi:GR25 family glycosyltransferase involved in LPS biosynthesis
MATVDQQAVAQHSSWLNRGVVGCSLSHAQAYREIIADDEASALVLEDDVTLGPKFSPLLEELESCLVANEVILLYWRTGGRCAFSAVNSYRLAAGHELMFPMEPSELSCTAAYIVTNDACRTMLSAVVPISTGPDAWGEFYERGGFAQLRCVVPRAVQVETRFKSTLGYVPSNSLAGRLSAAVAHRRIFPLYQVLGWKRAWLERRMSSFTIVNQPSLLGRDGDTGQPHS